MGDVVNLRRARKKAERQPLNEKAAANRLLHGRSKAERELEATARPRPAATSTATGSKRETSDEIAGRQTLHRHRRSQDERQPRGCILEGAQGDRRRARHDLVGPRRHDRYERQHGNLSSAIRLFVLDYYRNQLSDDKAGATRTEPRASIGLRGHSATPFRTR